MKGKRASKHQGQGQKRSLEQWAQWGFKKQRTEAPVEAEAATEAVASIKAEMPREVEPSGEAEPNAKELQNAKLALEPLQKSEPSPIAAPSLTNISLTPIKPLAIEAQTYAFPRHLRSLIVALANYAKSNDYSSDVMDPGFADILRTDSVETLMDKLMPGVRPQTMIAFELALHGNLELDDIKKLPSMEENKDQGVYGIFGQKNQSQQKKAWIALVGYIGYTVGFHKRRGEHIGHYNDRELKHNKYGSYLYNYLRKNFIVDELEFKVLAEYGPTMEQDYMNLFEGLMAIMFSSVQRPPSLLRDIAKECDMPLPSPLYGLNSISPLAQPCPHPMRSMELPCQNPVCGALTKPSMDKGCPRVLMDTRDIQKGFLCGYCYDWRRSYDVLPDRDIIERYHSKKGADTRKNAYHPTGFCDHCGDGSLPSDKKGCSQYSFNTKAKIWLCPADRTYYNNPKHPGQLPGPDILQAREGLRGRRQSDLPKDNCENCGKSGPGSYSHYNALEMRLCSTCGMWQLRHGGDLPTVK